MGAHIKKNSGFSFVEVLMATSLLAFISMASVSSISAMTRKSSFTNKLGETLLSSSIFLNQALQDRHAWLATVSDPVNSSILGCLLLTPVSCVDGTSGKFVAYDLNGNPNYQQFGFDINGEPCNPATPFNGVAGVDECPARYNFSVLISCVGASPCQQPIVKVTATVEYSPAATNKETPFNPNQYDVTVYKHNPANTSGAPGLGGSNTQQLQCATVTYQPNPAANSGAPVIQEFDPGNTGENPNFPALTIYDIGFSVSSTISAATGGPAGFSFQCPTEFTPMGCAMRSTVPWESIGDIDHGISWGGNGCGTDDEEYQTGQILSGVCCIVR